MSIFKDSETLNIPAHIRRVLNNYRVDTPEVKMIIQAARKLRVEVQSPMWLPNGAIAHLGFPKFKKAIQILCAGNRSTEYVREKRNSFGEAGWTLYPIKTNTISRRGFDGVLSDLKEIIGVK